MPAVQFYPRGPIALLDVGQSADRYIPPAEEVLTTPKPGKFYQTTAKDTPAQIAHTAYGAANRKAGLLTINRSSWNEKIRKAAKGWEVYGVKGFQIENAYSGPRSKYGSGKKRPVLWIPPDPQQGGEPEQQQIAPPSPAPTPAPSPPAPAPAPAPTPAPAPGPSPAPAPAPGPVSDGRYIPPAEEVLTTPKPGKFYQTKAKDTPAQIAHTAYGAANRKAGLLTINRSSWNEKIRKAAKGWEVYGVKGFQIENAYSGPRSKYGSGKKRPVLWIPPDPKQGGEPEQQQIAPPAPPVPPAPKPPAPPAPKPPTPTPAPAPAPAPDGRYIPPAEEVLTTPKPGKFYQTTAKDTPAQIAHTAYGAANRKAGLLTINRSSWNEKIRKAAKGWEVYGVKGFQIENAYSGPRSKYGSGKKRPVLWIPPDPQQGGEPEQMQPPTPPTPPAPQPPGPGPDPYIPPGPEPGPEPDPYIPPGPEPGPEPPIVGQPFPCSCPACGKSFMCSGTPWIPSHPPCPFTGHPWDYKPEPGPGPGPQPPEPGPQPPEPGPQPPKPAPSKYGDAIGVVLGLLSLARLVKAGE